MTPAARRRPRRGPEPDELPVESAAAQDAEPDPESVARSILLRQLTGAPRSRRQLEEALARRGVDEELGARLLDRFTEVGLVDDAEYAQMLVRSQVASRGLARRALAQELRRRGIADEHAADALAQVDDESEEQAARELLRRRWRAGPGVDPQVQTRRALAMLARKGYSSGLSSRLVREMVDYGGRHLDDHDGEVD